MPKSLSPVSLIRCADYQPGTLLPAVEKLLAPLEPLPLSPGARILLKPNCLSAHHGADQPVNTRVEVMEAVGRYLLERYPVKLLIADSGGMGSYGKTKRAYALMGLDRAAARLQADLINLEDFGLCTCHNPEGRLLTTFKATALLEQIDGIINLPKLKTHLLTGLTGAVKNVLGLLPGSLKRDVHVQAFTGPALSQALVDIYEGIRRKAPLLLHVLDGVTAMEGMGPSNGQARPTGWLLASPDPVALDVTGAVMMGFEPSQIQTIVRGAAAGLGQDQPARIRLIGADWPELPVPGFKHPFTRTREWVERMVPMAWIGRVFEQLYEAKPKLNPEHCRRCGQCLEACPAQALTLTEEGLKINTAVCIECYCCLEHCPHGGLWVPRGLKDRFRK